MLHTPLYQAIHSSIYDITSAPLGGGAWTPAQWFLASEQGGWWAVTPDFVGLYQDSAGTTPVTAVEQSVGRVNDRSGRGNHFTQATTANKPKLSARKNLLLATTALATQSVTLIASAHTLSFKGTGTVTLSGASTAGPLVGTGVNDRVSLTFTPSAGSVTFTVSGSVADAQLEYGSAVGTYQRVTTATDYATAGFPHYLQFDGFDDSMVTASTNFTGTSKMTVLASVNHTATAAGTIVELGNGGDSQAFWVQSCPTNIAGFGATTSSASGNTGYRATRAAGSNVVLSAQLDIAAAAHADKAKLRFNGVPPSLISTASSATVAANYRAGVLHMGRRGGVNTPHGGNIYQLVVRGAFTDDLTPGEAYLASTLGVTL